MMGSEKWNHSMPNLFTSHFKLSPFHSIASIFPGFLLAVQAFTDPTAEAIASPYPQ